MSAPTPGQLKTFSTSTEPASSCASSSAARGQRRQERVRQRVAVERRPAAEALAARDDDEVLARDVEQVGAQQAHEERERREPERDRGQDEVRERVPRRRPLARDQRVDV